MLYALMWAMVGLLFVFWTAAAWGLGALLLLLAGIALHVVIRMFAGRGSPPAAPAQT